jgi:hypothetical protein
MITKIGIWCGIIAMNLGLALLVEIPLQATICIGYASGALGMLWTRKAKTANLHTGKVSE